MKRNLTALIIALSSAVTASATLYSSSPDYNIPDDGSLQSFSITVSGNPETSITDVNVTLNISGGFNSDLYGYLVFDNGTAGNHADDRTVVLLNRIGITGSNPYGASGEGMNVTLSDGATDIHSAGDGVLANTWAPDGRAISPLSTGAQFDAASRQNGSEPLGLFDGLNPNGTWTLFLADMSGGETSTLVSWGLDIEAVPEPTTWALVIFAGLAGTVKLGRWAQRQRRSAGEFQV
jgi:subtilisin-like proprotein convertase family protein